MKYSAALVQKGELTVVLVQVDKDVLDVPGRARDALKPLQSVFPNMPIVFVARNSKGKLFFFGRPDIVDGMGEVTLHDAEWKEYTV
ncbi:MAG: hypothetical protein C4532_10155 [Candidatus Abyssobacteria bacterium SURF_17]|uniref:Uncharacterized protein n=1 Tax=Candidatus Abyssobacteria bacterium SURF_17 TaxID=2093361 RepID=A0A419EY05_9BACT|nr:MAG: hypothetical protein C4532_10155 [Candidatus Abyssubacteria bacterium SURF_17]